MSAQRMRAIAAMGAFVTLHPGCGQVAKDVPAPSAQPESNCETTPLPRELAQLSEDSRTLAMGPCGELSYQVGTHSFFVDASLSAPELLDGATTTATFDSLGRGLFYLTDAGNTLVYRDLRGQKSWSAELPPVSEEELRYRYPEDPPRLLDFYLNGPTSSLFRCQGTTLYDYDDAGQASAHDLGLFCPQSIYSAADALLVGPTSDGYRGVKFGSWQPYSLQAAGACPTLNCKLELNRQILTKDSYADRPMGDTTVPVLQSSQYFDAETGAEVDYRALTTPDHGVVVVDGSLMLQDAQRTFAVTELSGTGEGHTTVRYFGPDPAQPERWLTSSFMLEPDRGSLHALASDDLQRIAVWSQACDGAMRTLLTFAPGHDPTLLAPALSGGGCVTKIDWVGSDGTFLAEISDTPNRLALIYPDQRVVRLGFELDSPDGVLQAISDGRVLAIVFGLSRTLNLIDLETGEQRAVATGVDKLFTDRARKRLAFRAMPPGSGDPRLVWAGAFPH